MGGGRHLPPELVTDRRQGGRDVRDPAAQGRTRQVQPVPEEDSFESIERQVIDILRDNHVRQQPFGGQRFLKRLRRRRRFDHALVTTRTGILEACRFDHPQTRWDILQFFRHGLANPRLHVTARADLVRLRHIDLHALPRQPARQQPAAGGWRGPSLRASRPLARVHFNRLGRDLRLVGELRKRQSQLIGADPFGFLAEQPLAEEIELMLEDRLLALQLRDFTLQRRDQRAGGREIVDVAHAFIGHADIIRDADPQYKIATDDQATRSYHRRRRVRAISTPESNSARSALRISTDPEPSSVGHAKVPRSRRLYKTKKPDRSHASTFSRSPRRFRNRNKWPERGSSVNRSRTSAERPSIDRRKSVAPVAM